MDALEEVHEVAQRIRRQMELIRSTVILEDSDGDAWERETAQPDPELDPDSVPPMEEPTQEWEQRRLSELRGQMRRNWRTEPRPLVRRKLPLL